MLSFECDYNNGCHEAILRALAASNGAREPGYGEDSFSASARDKIRAACQCPDADIYFLNGGTQANYTVIDALLSGYEGVIAADSGHVAVHEAGAIEFTGHKVLPLPSHDGKLDARELNDYLSRAFADGNRDHMVWPGMVYISYPTELGTLYGKEELAAIYRTCTHHGIPLYIDGARLGYGLMTDGCDLTLPELATLCDVFYIGGTKVGALSGEAVVFPRGNTPRHFITTVKQHGALSAKGRLIGVQFDALFTDGLYFVIARNAIEKAGRLKDILHRKGYRFYLETPTNQQFILVENHRLDAIGRDVRYSFWDRYDDAHTVIRLCTSWATTDAELDALEQVL